jgi:hypothetical protein
MGKFAASLSDRETFTLRWSAEVSHPKRKNKYAPSAGHPALVQQ